MHRGGLGMWGMRQPFLATLGTTCGNTETKRLPALIIEVLQQAETNCNGMEHYVRAGAHEPPKVAKKRQTSMDML